MARTFKRFCADTSGATAIEYALIGSIVSVAVVVGATSIGGTLNSSFASIVTSLR